MSHHMVIHQNRTIRQRFPGRFF